MVAEDDTSTVSVAVLVMAVVANLDEFLENAFSPGQAGKEWVAGSHWSK